jgi:hypothetical protein
MRRRGRRRKQLLGDLRQRVFWKLKEKALGRTVRRTRFGPANGPVVIQTTEWMNEWMNEWFLQYIAIIYPYSTEWVDFLMESRCSLWGTNGTLRLTKERSVVTHRYTILQETEKTWPILNRPTIKHVMFLRKYKDKHFLWIHHFDRRCVCHPAV